MRNDLVEVEIWYLREELLDGGSHFVWSLALRVLPDLFSGDTLPFECSSHCTILSGLLTLNLQILLLYKLAAIQDIA